MAATVDGDERVIAAAQQIVKSLATSKNMTEDMIMILSNFDNRLSTITDLLSPSGEGGGGGGGGELEYRLDAAEKVIQRWESPCTSGRGSIPWEESPDEAAEYLAAVDEILSLTEEEYDGETLDRAERVLQVAMARLEEEFRHVLIQNTVPLDPAHLYGSIRRMSLSFASDGGGETAEEDFESSAEEEQQQEGNLEDRVGSDLVGRLGGCSLSVDLAAVELIRPEAVIHLKGIAERMIRSRYEKECCQVYSSVRREVLDECLLILGVDRMSIEEVQRIEWTALDEKMKRWIRAVKAVVRVLLSGEKQLCDQIFGAASELIAEVCFTETAKGCVIQLLSFGEAITIVKRSPEKLFRTLDMYDALSEVMPELQAMFPEESSREFICGEAEGILRGLGDAAKGTLAEFENAVQRETSRKPIQWGDIHPLTRYVMNYVQLVVEYNDTFNGLLDEGGDCSQCEDNDDSHHTGSTSPLGRHVLSMISYLESNIEEKSKLYEDSGLQYIFLMNNILYVVQKVKDSELGLMLGNDWVRKRRGQVRQYATSYLRASWTRVLAYLKDEGIGVSGSSSNVSKVALKERFKNFNMGFEEIIRIQTAWKVPDPQLREELRISVSEKVIPAYRSFMGRFGGHLEGVRHAAKYIKYSPDDLEKHLLDLFEGSTGPSNYPRRKT